jgi:hypothetical protein
MLIKLDFTQRIFGKNQIYYLIKIRLLGAELFPAEGQIHRQTERQTDMIKLTVAFRYFANAPKNEIYSFNSFYYIAILSKQRLATWNVRTLYGADVINVR